MADNKKSVNLLPEYLRSDKNAKFLSSTIDQFIQAPQLERINSYVGSKLSPNYDPVNDIYLTETLPLRKNYQLEPALVFKDESAHITDVVGFNDLINELAIQGSNTTNFDNLLRSKFYSYDPFIDWDKLINYSDYYWIPTGPKAINILTADISLSDIVGQTTANLPYIDAATGSSYAISNGMKLIFDASETYEGTSVIAGREYIVEGVGNSIRLVEFDKLEIGERFAQVYNETFDSDPFDDVPFDGDKKLPVVPEYITINRSSADLNSWSRYNRWFHKDIIRVAAEIGNIIPSYTAYTKAQRPIVEFKPNLQLYNFGVRGLANIDLVDTITTDALNSVQGTFGYYVDEVLLESGHRVIFNADSSENVRGKIYTVSYENGILQLTPDLTPSDQDSVSVTYGTVNAGSTWHYDSTIVSWVLSQQHTTLNQAPLFDLYTNDGVSYTDPSLINNFQGTKIFGYDVGTGTADSVLGFPLKYEGSYGIGSFLFKNYFMTDVVSVTENNVSSSQIVGIGYIRENNTDGTFSYTNIWKATEPYQIPVIEIQTASDTTDTFTLNSLDAPASSATSVISFVNNVKVNSTIVYGNTISVVLDSVVKENDSIRFEIVTDQVPNNNGYYQTPLSLTNNPLNGPISTFSLSELSDHLSTMVANIDNLTGVFPGTSNLRDFDNFSKYGTRFIINANSIVFAQLFLGKKEHNVVDAIRSASDQYNQFKMNLLRSIVSVDSELTPADALDYVLKFLNKNKDSKSPYYRSDMIPYGSDKVVKEYTVGVFANNEYPVGIDFDISSLSFSSVLIYLNDLQLTYGKDYNFNTVDNSVIISRTLVTGDSLKVCTYTDTLGSFIPPTPSKLGLYPKFEPELYTDTSYVAGPVTMIRCHDGSIVKAYGDYRDDIILEFEKRVYNNIKVSYDSSKFDIVATMPGAFRNSKFAIEDANAIIRKDFIKWAGVFNVDISSNSSFDEGDAFTWNFKGSIDSVFGNPVSGSWRSLFNYFYDTDRPHTHPWEMLGFSDEPAWWTTYYGSAPFTSTNTLMWTDLKNGYVRGTNETNPLYARPQLLDIIPVTSAGILKSPDMFLASANSFQNKQESWTFGDYSPAETAWRNSSYWPFVVNTLAALLDPSTYTSVMYDVSRITTNQYNQLVYGNDLYLTPKKLIVEGESNAQIAGFGNFIIEAGLQKDLNYISKLKKDIDYLDLNLFHKLGGFASKDKLQIVIDAIDPKSTGQSAILPPEDYSLILNVSNPIKSARISGIIVQKSNGAFVVKGYDRANPYFEILKPIKTAVSGAVTVGGVSAPFTEWSGTVNNGNSGFGNTELTSAQANTSRYYKQGQIVRYNNRYYRVKVGHNAQTTFDATLFQQLATLPMTGGASAQVSSKYDSSVTQVPYGTRYNTIQEVYDFISGYGAYLRSQGFIFDQYNSDLFETIDWSFTGKEFLFWTTQNWSDGSLITLSPFANSLKYQFANSVVDNISSGNYEYSLLKADGTSFPIDRFNLTRDDTGCTINTLNTEDGIFFAVLNSVQKEHAMVFNNTTVFNDTMYDIESGYKQQRIKLSGFRTSNWNGDLYSPGFIYDAVDVTDWVSYTLYNPGKVVRYNGSYYEANVKISGDETFDFTKWTKLDGKPTPGLIPNFDYKINQFEDFYSLDIDNFDSSQQQLSQHLLGYTQRPYLTNILTTPTTQYKFYQGFIKEKGTKNAIDKIAKVGNFNRNGSIDFKEEWAFRIGHFGGYETYKEVEFALEESNALENPYLVKFTDEVLSNPSSLINYIPSSSMLISPDEYVSDRTFETYITTEDNLKLTTAGYVKLNDVTATAYNKNSLLDLANNSLINEGDTIWLGFLENNDWTVYRYSRQTAKIAGVFVSAPGEDITFVTDYHHNLTVGDVVSVVSFNDQVNGVYIVKSIPTLNQFSVASEVSTIINEELLAFGALFKFNEVRYDDFAQVASEKDIIKLSTGEKIWIDNANGRWAVYEKLKNYNSGIAYDSPALPRGQELGSNIFANDDSPVVLVSAPSWDLPTYDSIGRVSVLERNNLSLEKQYEYNLNSNGKIYCESNTGTDFGYALNYDIGKALYFVGAPDASKVRAEGAGFVVYSTGTESAKTFDNEGVVKISSRNVRFEAELTERVLTSPADTPGSPADSRFGHSIYLTQVPSTATTMLLVGAPGNANSASALTGTVYSYVMTEGVEIDENPFSRLVSSDIELSVGAQWGHRVVGTPTGDYIAISAPKFLTSTSSGVVQIFEQTNNEISHKQTIYSPFGAVGNFGQDVFVSYTGKFLLVSAPNITTQGSGPGKVAVYVSVNGTYILNQIIDNPVLANDLQFGQSISLSKDETVLVISALGKNRSKVITFDESSRFGETTFDQTTTRFIAPISDAGAAYVFNNLGDYFIPAEELIDADIIEGSRYGTSVVATNDIVFVGAPWIVETSENDASTFFQFNKIDLATNSWKLSQLEPDLVNIDTVKRIVLIDSNKEEIIDYLDVIDPLKGKIAGVAEQELKYKSAFDPAIYSIGVQGAVVDNDTNWIDDQVGNLWWDLSTAKYTWYEQGDDLFRKNNWGKLFPGASIDVYEWVKSDLLPSEWAAQADTTEGLTNGISGQPKYADNSVISVKQVFNNVTNSFENVYYFWVKNKVLVPDIKNRRISSYQVASLISDPTANGLKFAEILSPNSVAFANVQPSLVGDYINANIATDTINNKIPRHTEWLLLEEGNSTSVPNTLLTKKLFDSLLGHDPQGKLVPDPTLSYRNRYGTGIRPQQSLFKDRLEALRNLVEFTNGVLIKNTITGNYSFENLNKEEPIPDAFFGEYDLIVEDLLEIDEINTAYYVRAALECVTNNGKLTTVNIVDPGYGYTIAPTVTVSATTGTGAVILTEINDLGQVVSATISNPGKNYTDISPEVTVRPHTVIVQANSDYGNRWSKHAYDYGFKTWVRIKTQTYNTKLFWKYVDWVKDTYDGYKDYRYVLNDSYEISKVTDALPGDYIKINNIGDGRYVILERVRDGKIGDFSTLYNIVYSERGTIQILDSIWDFSQSNYAYDIATLEETLYDQLPDLELFYILTALKDNIFAKDLKVNWNLFFFTAVKYALTEQKLLDWAFKTSFVDITNNIGELNQPAVYRVDNESSFEDYIKEVKPYRTKIRSYTSNYSITDTFGSNNNTVTDFDLPSYYNSNTNEYEIVDLTNPLIDEYPWKWWLDNYKYYVERIEVGYPGEGYTSIPTVVITTAPGDTGSGASAVAYIRRGQLYKILVSNPGSGYVIPPIITIVGGGAPTTSIATASAILANDTIRKNTVGIKFDRVGIDSEIAQTRVSYTFPPASGVDTKFVLPWLASTDKSTMLPLLDGKLVLSTDYNIEFYTEVGETYTKRYSRFVFLNYVPSEGQVLKVTYDKNINLYTAVDRINNFYSPTDSMPGLELPLLMSGAEHGVRKIQGLPFSYSPVWGQGLYDNNSVWADLVDYYTSVKLVGNLTTGTSTLFLNTTTGVIPGQRLTLSGTSTNYIRHDTVVQSVNPVSRSITVNNESYQLKRIDISSATNQLLFYTVEDYDSYIQVGDVVLVTGTDNLTEINNVDGRYIVTGVGEDRFTADSIQVLTTSSSIRRLSSTASVQVPAIIGTMSATTTYRTLVFTESVSEVSTATFEIGVPIIDASALTVYYTPTFGSPRYLNSNVVNGEWFSKYQSSTGTFVSVYNLGTAPGNIHTFEISVYEYPTLELWQDNFSAADLDTELSAGSWNSAGDFVGALGVNPTDLSIDGSTFLNSELGYAPEELVKGQTLESVGISVYTQNEDSSALAVTGSFPVYANKVSIVDIGISLEEAVGIMVHYNGQILNRLTDPPDPAIAGPYFSLVNATPSGPSGQLIASDAGDDTFTGPYTLGFEWNMFGEKFTDVYVGTNGYLTFGNGSAEWTPLAIGSLPVPTIFVEFCDLWQALGISGQGLASGSVPGLYISQGTRDSFNYWKLRFQGTHYNDKDVLPLMPDYNYEVTLYSNGVDQYVEMLYEDPWRGTHELVPTDDGFIVGIASASGTQSIEIPSSTIDTNSSHVFYSTSNGGNWQYAGRGSFDPTTAPYTFTAPNEFFVVGGTLYVAPQPTSGRGGYSLLQMGGEYVIDSNMSVASTQTIITSSAKLEDVRSVFVTVNGEPIDEVVSPNEYGFMIVPSGPANNRAAVAVYNMSNAFNTVQAWFLKTNYPKYNRMYTDVFEVTTTQDTFILNYPPSTVEPSSSQLIVELSDATSRRRLSPPKVSYYTIQKGQTIFEINNDDPDTSVYGPEQVKVYGNGELLRPGFDYIPPNTSNTITLISGLIGEGDLLAVEALQNYDYEVAGNILRLRTPVENITLRVITFTDQDNLLVRTETFVGSGSQRYVLDLPVINENYVWVYLNGSPLIAGVEYSVLEDLQTVQITKWINTGPGDVIIITSVNSPKDTNIVLGYRIFKDIFDRVQYTRIADSNSTRLSKELTLDDTEIHVYDSSKLIPPNPYKNKPGVIFIDSERIEFFETRDNKLSNLRRSTMGTAPATFSEIGTKVVDQSPQQYMLSQDAVYKQYHVTSDTTSSYVLNAVTDTYNTYTFVISAVDFVTNTGTLYQSGGSGIRLSTDTTLLSNGTTIATNQLIVKYGGRPLRKTAMQIHNVLTSYDSTPQSLTTLDPEFTVTYNAFTGNHELNLLVDNIMPGIQIDIEQKLGHIWEDIVDNGTTKSLLDSTSTQARFLMARPAVLPDSDYYGGNPVLTDDNNFELTDDDNNPIRGY
jgi:hypothetical protein